MARLLCIVSRRQPALYERARREFAGDAELQVLLDRRRGDRRQRNETVASDRRQTHQRRRGQTADLETLGWAVVPAGSERGG